MKNSIENSDVANVNIVMLASHLADLALINKYQLTLENEEELYENVEGVAQYKFNYQLEFDEFYDYYYNIILKAKVNM